MLDAKDIIKIIKQCAIEAVKQADPQETYYGTVIEAEEGVPTLIMSDQQWEIFDDQIVVPQTYKERTLEEVKVKSSVISDLRNVMDHLGLSYTIDEDCGRDEALCAVTIKDFLKEGDKVILQRQQGGQSFLVTGRTVTEEEE